MKTILIILFLALSVSMIGQEIEPAEIVTGSNTGDAEIKAAFRRYNTNDSLARLLINAVRTAFNWEDSIIETITISRFSTGNFLNNEYDLIVGDNDTASVMKIGNLEFGTSDDRVVGEGLTAGGAAFFAIQSLPDGIMEFVFTTAGGDIRFALPRSGPSYGTYNPRSMIIAGPSVMNDSIMMGFYWGFNRLWMDTNANGADLGVQNCLQVGDSAYINTYIVIGGDQFTSQSDSTILKPDSIITGQLKLNSLVTYANNAAAITGGLLAGDLYRTATGELMIVY